MTTTSSSSRSKPLLVLDLDHTLVACYDTPIALGKPPADFWVMDGEIHGYLRPYVHDFLHEVQKHYDVGIWSSSGLAYIKEVLSHLIPEDRLKFVWTERRCTLRRHWNEFVSYPDVRYGDYYHVKKLKKVARVFKHPLERILMVDDSPEKMETNWGNWIPIRPFHGERSDTELVTLTSYLCTIAPTTNFRALDKRRWRNHESVRAGSDQPS